MTNFVRPCLQMALALTALAWPFVRFVAIAAPPAGDPPPHVRAFLAECESLRKGTIASLEQSLRGLQSGQVPARDKSRAIRQVESDLEALRAGSRLTVPALRFPPAVGAIGRLPDGGAHVEQILGPDKMLVRTDFHVKVVVVRHYRSITETVHRSQLFKIRGLPTGGFSIGSDVSLLQVFEIIGNETYRTSDGGARTVLVLKPFEPSDWAADSSKP